MFLISFTLVLLEPHCFVWQTGLASLFAMLQWCHARADFLAMARACSSWALPRPGLKKKHFSVFEALFSSQGLSPSYAWWHLPHHLWTMKQMHLGAFPSMGANWHRISLVHTIELCTLLEKWPCAICPLEWAQWHRLGRKELIGS